jgi:O-antigen/teichoic acid export membrane protein
MSGTAAAQIISFALSPVISRLFSPTDFGIAGSFAAVAIVLSTVVTLQYSQALILPKTSKEAINLLAVSCFTTLLLSLLCFAACMIAPSTINGLISTTGILIPVLLVGATLVAGLNQSFQGWCVRTKAFKQTSTSQVIRSLTSGGAQVASGSLSFGAVGLIVSAILADIMATINLAPIVLRDWRPLRENVVWQNMRRLALDYRDFPIYNTFSNLINSLSLQLPMLLLTHFYGLAVAGSYAFALRILTTPMSFILSSLRQVLLQKAAEVHNEGRRLIPLYAKISLGLFALAMLPSLVLFAYAPRLFGWIFGPQWVLAGEFSSSLVVWLVFMFCNLPASLFGRIIRIQRQMFLFDLSVLLLRTASLYIGGMYFSSVSTISFFSWVGGLMNILFIGIVGHKLWKAEAGKQNIHFAGDLT